MAKKKASWTVMVYLAGDNNLTTECMFALTEMKQAALGKYVNVIAQFDPNDPFVPTHRYEISRRGKKKTLHEDIIDRAGYVTNHGEVSFTKESSKAKALAKKRRALRQSHPTALEEANLTGSPEQEDVITDDTDTGSPITLYNFISFCLENYRADHYMVVLSGHAGGTERDYLLKDESTAGSLTFNELKNVFKRVKEDRGGKEIDILGMDNCLMSMAEICYELRDLVGIVVGCESFSPASGWPYRQVLERLRKDFVSPKLPPGQSLTEAAARAIVEEYINYYSNYWLAGLSVTQSALNVAKVKELHGLIEKLALVMEQQLIQEWKDKTANGPTTRAFHDALLLAHWEAQSYNGEQFVDLYDFCNCLEARANSEAVAEQCKAVKEFISSEFVLMSCYCGAAYQYSYGVSMYFPWSQVAPSYWNLDFIRDSNGAGWGRFLRTYTLLTRRAPRGLDEDSRLAKTLSGTIEDSLISIRMTSDRMTSDRMTSDRMTSDRMTSDRMTSDRMTSDRMTSDRMTSDRMTSDRMTSDRMTSDRMTSDRMTSDRMTSDRMTSGLPRNMIQSMRNPPNLFLPDECIRDRRSSLATQEILRRR